MNKIEEWKEVLMNNVWSEIIRDRKKMSCIYPPGKIRNYKDYKPKSIKR